MNEMKILDDKQQSFFHETEEPLCYLTESQMAELKESCRIVVKQRGEVVYREGDAADCCFMIVSGKVKIFKGGVNGREQIVKMGKMHDVFGYRAALAEEPHSASAAALENTVLLTLSQSYMQKITHENPEVAAFVIRSLARELSFSRRRSVSLSQKQIRGRLAESLLVLRDKYGYVGSTKTLNVQMTREDLANLSNMTTSNAIRTLANFAQENLVEVEGRDITVCDEAKLERISRMG